jgi:hypothetical protein
MWIDANAQRLFHSPAAIRAAHPNVSFPATMPDSALADLGLFRVVEAVQPTYDSSTQTVDEAPPALVDGVWTQQWVVRDLTADELQARVPKSVSKLQGMLAIAEVGLAAEFLAWKASLDPVADFAALAFLEGAQTWEYDNELLNAALAALGIEAQKDTLFFLASSL